ncbi:adenylate/guanylate cyclase domain-containing protein [Magnetococcus sp. PR-3]|uniref:adenylate/guanylate cyclase domain-containing protein n=1 Tax=Magnetococcus sp. PR-3 TaxID=3120355 RepID=UPI002FCE3512
MWRSGSGEWIKKRLFQLLAVVFLVVAVVMGLAWLLPSFHALENHTSDHRIAHYTPFQPQHEQITLVMITEETLKQFPYRWPLDRSFVADLLQALQNKGVRAIGLDVLFHQESEAHKDRHLHQTIRDMKVPTVVHYATTKEGVSSAEQAYLEKLIPPSMRGLAQHQANGVDKRVRHLQGGYKDPQGKHIPSFAHQMMVRMSLKTDHEAQAIRWRRGPDAETSAFNEIPAHLVTSLPDHWFKDKIVLIGVASAYTPSYQTPLSLSNQGQPHASAMIHAQALAHLLANHKSPHADRMAVLIHFGGALLVGLLLGFSARLWARVSLVLLVMGGMWWGVVELFQQGGVLLPFVGAALVLLVTTVTTDRLVGKMERRDRNLLKQAFSRYLSPDLLKQLLDDPSRLTRTAERRELTFLFTDLEGFTTLSEQSEPLVLGRVMNAYFDGVCSIVMNHGGLVVDLIGDAVFAIFNAPVAQKDHAQRAVRCSQEIALFTRSFQEQQQAEGIPVGATRIGLHTGQALVGNFGSEQRFKYAALGDAVNVAARIEGLNKIFGTRVCSSREVLQKTEGNSGLYRSVGSIALKGKEKLVDIEEVVDPQQYNQDYLKQYRTAYEALTAGEVDTALTGFKQLLEQNPDDHCSRLHVNRIEQGATNTSIYMKQK